MAAYPPDYRPDPGNSSIFGKQILLLALFAIAIFVLYKVFFQSGTGLADWLKGPEKVDVTYVEADFQPNLDEEATLRILSSPEQYKKEFESLVYSFNMSLLYHIANRMDLNDSLKRQLEPLYQVHHDYLKNLYYEDFVELKDTSAALYSTFYQDHSNEAVRVFNEVAGKYTCFFVTQIVATLLKTSGGQLMAKGEGIESPCAIALKEGLHPMVERLRKRAEILDFSASRDLLREKVQQGIAELATYEIRDKKGLDKTLQYKILGYSVSETNIQVEAISVIKAGIKLDQGLDVTFSPKKGIVYVTLPDPVILSHEVYPRVDKLDVGFLSGVSGADLNQPFNDLRTYFREDAIKNEQIFEKSKARVDSVLQLLLEPVVKGINRQYKLETRYRSSMQQ